MPHSIPPKPAVNRLPRLTYPHLWITPLFGSFASKHKYVKQNYEKTAIYYRRDIPYL